MTKPLGVRYRIRIDEMRLNAAMNVIEFRDADTLKWVVIGWFDGAIRDAARSNERSLQSEMDAWNEVFRQGDPSGLGHLHRL